MNLLFTNTLCMSSPDFQVWQNRHWTWIPCLPQLTSTATWGPTTIPSCATSFLLMPWAPDCTRRVWRSCPCTLATWWAPPSLGTGGHTVCSLPSFAPSQSPWYRICSASCSGECLERTPLCNLCRQHWCSMEGPHSPLHKVCGTLFVLPRAVENA